MSTKYFVIRDAQEKLGWIFDKTNNCEGMEIKSLPTGDYTIRGYEDKICIERKRNTGEFATNIIQGRFEAELLRMESFAFPFMVLEFTMDDIMSFPVNSGIPKDKWPELKITPFFMLRRLMEFEVKYKTKIVLAGRYGKEVAASLFKRVIENGIECKKTRKRT